MPHRLLLLLAFFPLLFRLLSGKAGRITAVDLLIGFCGLWGCVSLFANHDPGRVIEAAGAFFLEFSVAYMVGRVAIRNAEEFRSVVSVMLLAMLVLAPMAAFESVTNTPILDMIPNSHSTVHMQPRMGLRRAQVVFPHPITFGVFMAAGFALIWFVVQRRFLRVLGLLSSVVGTFFSLSVGALLALIVQAAFIFWELVLRQVKHRWKLFAGLSAMGYVAIDLASNRTPFHLVVEYLTFSSRNAYNRIQIWRFGTDNVADNPIFGIGLNDWVRPAYMSSSVDNFWLLLTMQNGLPLIIAFVLAIVIALRRVSLAELNSDLAHRCRAGYLVALGGIFIAGATVHYWHAQQAFVLFLFGSGMWLMERHHVPEHHADEGSEPEPGSPKLRYTRFPSAAKDTSAAVTRSAPLSAARPVHHSRHAARN